MNLNYPIMLMLLIIKLLLIMNLLKKLGDYSDTISLIRENAEFANSLAEEKPEIVTINGDLSLSFDIEDEYAEQWDAWKLSWSFWKGWTLS